MGRSLRADKQVVISYLPVAGIVVQIVRKSVKNLYLRINPSDGQVRVVAPLTTRDEAIHRVVNDQFDWIRRQQEKFTVQPFSLPLRLVSGERHYFLGQCYHLRVHERADRHQFVLCGVSELELYVRPGSDVSQREAILSSWYRAQLKTLIPPLLGKWQPALGVQVAVWGIKRMKTRWGSCNPSARRIWLNLELIKKPVSCLEYVVVHELLHFYERYHNRHFKALLDQYLPNWRQEQQRLNERLPE